MAKRAVLLAEVRGRVLSGEARRLRLAHRLSLSEVADEVGVSTAAVFAWEAGEYLPRGEHALAYANLLRDLARTAHERQA